jgi:hypothetical protein
MKKFNKTKFNFHFIDIKTNFWFRFIDVCRNRNSLG